jgi:dCTP deaminase
MAVLTRDAIKERLNKPVSNKQSLVITPFLGSEKEVLDLDAIDLRLGSHFLLPQIPAEPFADPTVEYGLSHTEVHKPLGSYFVLPAHQTVLGATLEFIKLPCDLSGQILTKSSVARMFVVIETAPWIHPLYRGCLTLEIANVSNTPLILYPGLPIGQLILLDADPECRPEEPLQATYVGPIRPEPPPFKPPKASLRSIGIRKYKTPHHSEWQSTD